MVIGRNWRSSCSYDAFGLGGFMRISYATADEVLVDALARIKKAADSIEGVDAAIASIEAEKAAK